jgi:hypothetical protein
MNFQAGILIAIAVILVGGTIYYFNEEYPERIKLTRLGLGITVLGFGLLFYAMFFLRQWPR